LGATGVGYTAEDRRGSTCLAGGSTGAGFESATVAGAAIVRVTDGDLVVLDFFFRVDITIKTTTRMNTPIATTGTTVSM